MMHSTLPQLVRHRMESFFGEDFSTVRIHISDAPERYGAVAFAYGTEVHVAKGRFDPETFDGIRVLGHELAHVVQQRQGRAFSRTGCALLSDPVLEHEADMLGLLVAHAVTADLAVRCVGMQGQATGLNRENVRPIIQCLLRNDGTIDGAARPGEPDDWSKTTTKKPFKWPGTPPVAPNVQIPMTFHHIMPWNRIWRYWNVFVNAQEWDVLRAWSYLLGLDDVIDIYVELLGPSGAGLNAGIGPLSKDDFETKLCWSTWNLVEGPGVRTKGRGALEDPGEYLDLHYKVSRKLAHRQNMITALDGYMANCERAAAAAAVAVPPGRIPASSIRVVIKQLADMRSMRNEALTKFDPHMWRPAKIGSIDSAQNVVLESRYDEFGLVEAKKSQADKDSGSRGRVREMVWEKMPL